MVERNPSPPREFEDDADKFRQDMIGSTAISKKWVFATLLDVCKEVEKHESTEEDVVDVSDELQDEACKLWDLSIERDVALFLVEAKAIELMSAVIYKSKSPRLNEILIGILGNMSCTSEVCCNLTNNDEMQTLVVSLLGSRDSPMLVELGRLLNTCLANKDCKGMWVDAIEKAMPECLEDIVFILNSSTNTEVLEGILVVMDSCLDASEALVKTCLNSEFVNSVVEAGFQFLKDEDSYDKVSDCLHILHTLSTTECELNSLLNPKSKSFKFSMQCITIWCEMEDFSVGTDPSNVAVASCLSLINFMLLNSDVTNDESNAAGSISSADRKCLFDLSMMVKKQFTPSSNKGDVLNRNSSHEDGADKSETAEAGETVKLVLDKAKGDGNDEGKLQSKDSTESNISLFEISCELLSTLRKAKFT